MPDAVISNTAANHLGRYEIHLLFAVTLPAYDWPLVFVTNEDEFRR